MAVDPREIHSEQHVEIGSLIQRDAGIVISRWSRRAVEEQPQAKRVHHEALLDELSSFLWELGRSLAESGDEEGCGHWGAAREHGEQRWENGWSLPELVRDYQILRLVLVEYLEEQLERPLNSREVMALGLALDEAISASVSRYVRSRDEALRQHEQALKEANRRKDEFLAMLGHELRNPLAPIRNALNILALQGPEPALVEWARGLMERQVEHMTRILEDLLDVSRIARGKIVLRREQLDLAALVRATAEDRRSSFKGAGLTLTLDVPGEPLWVEGDPTRLTQVVGNLLHNAGKFTDAGGAVTVHVRREHEKQRAVVVVRDTGIGIEPDVLAHIFDTYVQSKRGLERSPSGLGLGLALAKGLVELHGGEVIASSDGAGRGSEFTFWLPLATRAPAPPPEESSAGTSAAKPLRLLVVEDNHDSADSLKMLLELYGHEVRVAYSGPAGLAAARQTRPDVALCNLELPGMDGYTFASSLRADPDTASVRLIALSGHGSEADQQRCREAGFEILLIKPVDASHLQRALAQVGTSIPS